jgi:peptidoglycan/LPS O-acetylase OafA/YrhL
MAFVVSFAVYATITVALATVLHYTVELPLIKAGKRLASRMKPSIINS